MFGNNLDPPTPIRLLIVRHWPRAGTPRSLPDRALHQRHLCSGLRDDRDGGDDILALYLIPAFMQAVSKVIKDLLCTLPLHAHMSCWPPIASCGQIPLPSTGSGEAYERTIWHKHVEDQVPESSCHLFNIPWHR